jgi:hypothetical protein
MCGARALTKLRIITVVAGVAKPQVGNISPASSSCTTPSEVRTDAAQQQPTGSIYDPVAAALPPEPTCGLPNSSARA